MLEHSRRRDRVPQQRGLKWTRRSVLRSVAPAALAVITAEPASAQVFVDVFAGRSSPERTPISLAADQAEVDGQVVPARLRVDVESIEPTDSTIYGVRAGYWFNRWVGVAVDLATLAPDVGRQRISATANLRFDDEVFGEPVVIDPGRSVSVTIPRITVPTTATIAGLAMVRAPIGATQARPHGAITPYGFAGPVWLITSSDLDGDFGLRAGGGVRIPLGRRVGIFAEYRYTRVDAGAVAGRIGGEARGVRGDTGDIRVDLRLRDHAGVGGLSFSF